MTNFTNAAGDGSVVADVGTFTSLTATTATIGTITASTSLANGSAAAPSLFFTNSTTTGLFRSGSNIIGFAANGASVATMDANGINGIVGGTTPAAGSFTTVAASGVLTASVGAVGTPSITFSGDTNTGLYWVSADSFALTANGVAQATITTGGINGILGATTPAAATITTATITTLAGPTTTSFPPQLIAAAGATQGAATAITNTMVIITTCTASARGIKLPTAATGKTVVIISACTQGTKIWPGTNARIKTSATNTAVVQAGLTGKIYVAQNTTRWWAMTGT